ncbi:phosphotransferase [Actinoplanes sp. N902-109]|uniref:phosphotransferase n=1 Tax=Actinoplanes sp. (strain N902-109) TaxID=649831 RepID=UPI0003293FCA|nr:phosphotransferase [Actinoplanes sp. N902-109]AGL20221.1 Mn2+dependent serine/threonine protein kinase [Actinoplanes sp. N902-109]
MTGQPIASGREADVYALDDARVLRRYRRDTDVTGEANAMRHLAGLGYPVPAVHEATGSDMILERLDGPTMAAAVSTGDLPIAEAARMLAGLHRRLHELPPWGPGGPCILHLDLHPENVLLTVRGPVVIDWCNARLGDADLDLALTALILAEVSLWEHPMAARAGELLTAFLPLAPGDPRRLLGDAVARRRGQVDTLTAQEIATVDTAAELVRR